MGGPISVVMITALSWPSTGCLAAGAAGFGAAAVGLVAVALGAGFGGDVAVSASG